MDKNTTIHSKYTKKGSALSNSKKPPKPVIPNLSSSKIQPKESSGESNTLKPCAKPTTRKLFSSLEKDNAHTEESTVQPPSEVPAQIKLPEHNIFTSSTDSKLWLEKLAFQKYKKSINKQKCSLTLKNEKQYKLDLAYCKYLQNEFLIHFVTQVQKQTYANYDKMLVEQIRVNDETEENVYMSECVLKELLHIKNSFSRMDSLKRSIKDLSESLQNNDLLANVKQLPFHYTQLQIPNVHFSGSKLDSKILMNALCCKEGPSANFMQGFPDLEMYANIVKHIERTNYISSKIKHNIDSFDATSSVLFLLLLQVCSNNTSLQKVSSNKWKEPDDSQHVTQSGEFGTENIAHNTVK